MVDVNLEARVAALDVQVQSILRDLEGLDKVFPSIKDTLSIEQKVAILETEVSVIKSRLDKKIERDEFFPIRAVVYGLVGLVLLAVGSTIVKIVIPTITIGK
jgi:tetrahydromethanopterin S-methyltransferase subunit G